MTSALDRNNEVLERSTELCHEHGAFERIRTVTGWRGRCGKCLELEFERNEAEIEKRLAVQRVNALISRAELPPRFAAKGFDSYRPSSKGQERALRACMRYVEELPNRIRAGACLSLIGPPGVGKTHLLVAVTREACMREVPARYTTMPAFLAAVKGSWEWHGEERGVEFVRPPLLALDEVWQPASAREAGALLALIDERYRRGCSTLIASNFAWPQLQEEMGARFCDRLLEGGEVIAVDGKSARRVERGTA